MVFHVGYSLLSIYGHILSRQIRGLFEMNYPDGLFHVVEASYCVCNVIHLLPCISIQVQYIVQEENSEKLRRMAENQYFFLNSR